MSNLIPPRRWFSEVAINLYSRGVVVIPPDQIHSDGTVSPKMRGLLENCHIYLICRRPVVSVDPRTFKFVQDTAIGHLVYKERGVKRRLRFKLLTPPGYIQNSKVDPYPHRSISNFDKNGEFISSFPASMIPFLSRLGDGGLNDFEVLYVGQAYGDGSRSALDRLRNHSTLQKILAENSSKGPDDEIILFLVEYDPYRIISSFDGISKSEEAWEEDKKHWVGAFQNYIDEKTQICLAEAALIRYFYPEYNEIYKDNFPNDNLKILYDAYPLDFSGLIVELNTEEVAARLFSRNVGPGRHHISEFDLHDPDVRRSFFSFVDREGRYFYFRESGPRF